jgi:hypothetical protein
MHSLSLVLSDWLFAASACTHMMDAVSVRQRSFGAFPAQTSIIATAAAFVVISRRASTPQSALVLSFVRDTHLIGHNAPLRL